MWWLWLEHLKAGGYGVEFSEMYPAQDHDQLVQLIALRELRLVPRIRHRHVEGDEWWQLLSLDPLTQVAAWARPRPLRERPSAIAYVQALQNIQLDQLGAELLQCHAEMPNSSAVIPLLVECMRSAFGTVAPRKIYQQLGRQLCVHLGWEPDRFRNGYPNWCSVLAECFKNPEGEVEWVLLPVLRGIKFTEFSA